MPMKADRYENPLIWYTFLPTLILLISLYLFALDYTYCSGFLDIVEFFLIGLPLYLSYTAY